MGQSVFVLDWRGEAEVLVDRILQVAPSATVTREVPTDRLLVIKLHSSVEGAADLHLVVSERALILGAGKGLHLDLDALPSSRDEATEAMLAVINGGLTERIGSWGVRSTLMVEEQTLHRAYALRGCVPRPRRARVVRYAPY